MVIIPILNETSFIVKQESEGKTQLADVPVFEIRQPDN
jgi:hypothetical protein